jgi:predicted Zn-dependent protease
MQKFPGEPDFGDTLGSIYLKRGLKDSALQVFQNLTRQNPKNPTFRYHLGMALLATGDNAGAKNELNEALIHQPSPDQRRTIAELLAKLN